MLKFLGFMMVLGGTFWIGLYVGQQGPENVLRQAQQLGADVVAKTTAVERGLTLRTGLVHAKERLVQAKSDLLDKNYGKAVVGLDEAAQALNGAKDAAGEELRRKLEQMRDKVAEAKISAQALKPGLPTTVDELVKEVDRILAR